MEPPPIRWRRAFALSAMALYGAQLIPFFVGPLHECDHCVGLYWTFYPAIPGFLAARLLGMTETSAIVLAAVVAALLFVGVSVAARRLPPWAGKLLLISVFLASAFHSYGVSHALRM